MLRSKPTSGSLPAAPPFKLSAHCTKHQLLSSPGSAQASPAHTNPPPRRLPAATPVAPMATLQNLLTPHQLLEATLRERRRRGWAAVALELEPFLDAEWWPSGLPLPEDFLPPTSLAIHACHVGCLTAPLPCGCSSWALLYTLFAPCVPVHPKAHLGHAWHTMTDTCTVMLHVGHACGRLCV